MSADGIITTIKIDAEALQSALDSHLEEIRALVVRMEAAAVTIGRDGLTLVEADQPIAFTTLSAVRSAAPEAPGLGMLATAVVAGAALAGSTTRSVSRRALLSMGFLRRRG